MKYRNIFNKDNETVVVFVSIKRTDDISVNTVLDTCAQLATEYDYYLDDIKTMTDYILLIYQKYDEDDDEEDDTELDDLLEQSRGYPGLKIGKLVKSKLG